MERVTGASTNMTNVLLDERRTLGLCTFWLGGKLYGLDVGLVGEVVAIDVVVPVPMSPPEVLGLFNLRGNPVVLLDLADVLGFPTAPSPPAVALVLHTTEFPIAFGADRMEAVVRTERGQSLAPGPEDHVAVAGFVTLESGVVTVLDPRVLLARVEQLRFSNEKE